MILTPQRRPLTEVSREHARAAPASQRRGVLISRAYEGGPEEHIDLIACVHCQRIFPYVRGSGNVRGWCMRCSGIHCGLGCEECVPWRQMIANLEAGMGFDQAKRHRPVTASVGGVLLGKG